MTTPAETIEEKRMRITMDGSSAKAYDTMRSDGACSGCWERVFFHTSTGSRKHWTSDQLCHAQGSCSSAD